MNEFKICPSCKSTLRVPDIYCRKCGAKVDKCPIQQRSDDKMHIPPNKIILLDLDYTLVSNSWEISHKNSCEKISLRRYEHSLIDIIKYSYVILMASNHYCESFASLKHIEQNTDLIITESYWNFGKSSAEIKKYWLETAVLPTYGYDGERYIAIESNPRTRFMYEDYGIKATHKHNYI